MQREWLVQNLELVKILCGRKYNSIQWEKNISVIMRSYTINLKILLVGDIQYPKGMSNSDFFFIAVCLGGLSWKTVKTFMVLAGWLVVKK